MLTLSLKRNLTGSFLRNDAVYATESNSLGLALMHHALSAYLLSDVMAGALCVGLDSLSMLDGICFLYTATPHAPWRKLPLSVTSLKDRQHRRRSILLCIPEYDNTNLQGADGERRILQGVLRLVVLLL